MEENKHPLSDNAYNLKSDALNEMLSKPPSWIVRTGNTLFMLLLLFILTLSWIIEYSEEVVEQIYITTKQSAEITNKSCCKVIAIQVKSGQIIEAEQHVFIELDVPQKELGMLEGNVLEISKNQKKGYYAVKVRLKNPLKLTVAKEITETGELKGKIRIITNKKRLLERLFESLFMSR